MLSEAEHEYVTRAGSTSRCFWVDSPGGLCRHANVASTAFCKGEYTFTSPVGHFQPNGFGLFDTVGNVWEWTQDCYNSSCAGAPVDGTARESADCRNRAVRGGAWSSSGNVELFTSTDRNHRASPSSDLGARVARTC
jgi:formylglycine-generating enzyme